MQNSPSQPASRSISVTPGVLGSLAPTKTRTNENTHGLPRQYFPKRSSLYGFSQQDLNKVAHRLNTRPRKTLDFETPADMLNQLLQ